ncbi:MAG TPA: 3-dehydroquinate synthase [Candidatus Massiliomicrobiota merdigallinarum]|nr:3-dehydroquinate synthase [Candidatus Massilimicrobiota merdigallinarum]
MDLKVNLGKDSYKIYIRQGLLDHILEYIEPLCKGKQVMIISDDQVYSYYGQKLTQQLSQRYRVGQVVIPHGEQSKRFDILPDIYHQLLAFHLTRSDAIIALGGGVIGDLAGFVASTFLRGVQFIQIPTSLLAQVDSSVGGKVAVDLPEGKNLVGAFKHPGAVFIDPLTLKTLDQRYINDGMGEVIKYGCIFDQSLFQQLLSYTSFDDLYQDIDEIIYRCVDLKRIVVEKDLLDFGDRLALNFGHTLGHAIEQYYHYEKYSHGEAISIGMVQLSLIAEKKGLTQKGTADQIKKALDLYHLPCIAHIPTEELKKAMALDKKNINQKLSFVLLKEIGDCFIYPSDLSFIDESREV